MKTFISLKIYSEKPVFFRVKCNLIKVSGNRRFLYLSSLYDFVRETLGIVECSRILASLDTALLTSFPPFFPFQLLQLSRVAIFERKSFCLLKKTIKHNLLIMKLTTHRSDQSDSDYIQIKSKESQKLKQSKYNSKKQYQSLIHLLVQIQL